MPSCFVPGLGQHKNSPGMQVSPEILALVDGEIIPSLNLLEASRACPKICCAPYSTTVCSLARNGQ